MPKVLDEDQLRRKQQLAEKRAARKKAAAEQAARDAQEALRKAEEERQRKQANPDGDREDDDQDKECYLLNLPEDAMRNLFEFLSAPELGKLTLMAKSVHDYLKDARASFLLSRLKTSNIQLLDSTANAEQLLQNALTAGGDTGRLVPKGKYGKNSHPEFVSFARFLEEAVTGHGVLTSNNAKKRRSSSDDDEQEETIFLPKYVEGRFVSVSPEHSLCRVGGDGEKSGAGGSGVASFGVGKRGQLGHGKREDQALPPRRLLGGFGYGIRIVQVAAGGGLVRVAHSLLLSSTGQVFSFGTGQYGALGHGYSAAKQLPDMICPTLIKGLASEKCICVSAGELHSAAITRCVCRQMSYGSSVIRLDV